MPIYISNYDSPNFFEQKRFVEQKDYNKELVNFYGTLKVEKMARLPIIGKMGFDSGGTILNIKKTDLYEYSYVLGCSFKNISVPIVRSIMEEIELLQDEKSNLSFNISEDSLTLRFLINIENIKDLEAAAKATNKFNL